MTEALQEPEALHVDQYYCLSLKGAEDRRELLESEWQSLGLAPRYFERERDREDPVRGCFESHVAICQDALANNFKTILILEDDFKLLPFSDKQRADANRFIDHGMLERYEMLFLGYIPRRVTLAEFKGLAYVQGNATHAYILGPLGIGRLAAAVYDGRPVDTYCKANFKQLALFPMVCIQQGGLLVSSQISGGGDGQNKWPRRLRKQYIWAYFRYAHKSLWNKLKALWTNPYRP